MFRKLTTFLIVLLILWCTGCKADNSSASDNINSKSENSADTIDYSNPDLLDQLIKTTKNTYVKTYDFKNFGDRTVLQLDYFCEDSDVLIPYCLIFPKKYNPKIKYPVFTYLHGAGEKGSDNNSHLNLMYRYCRNYPQFLDDSFIVCPQCPDGGWWTATGNSEGPNCNNLDVVMNALNALPKYCSVDTERYYVTGVSMGGFGTFSILEQYPTRFAAGIPICGGGNPYNAKRLVDIPLWLFHSRDDNIVSFEGSNSMYNAIKNAGGEKINFTILDGMGHNAWNATEHNDDLFRWIFGQSLNNKKPLLYSNMLEIRNNKDDVIFTEEDFVLSISGNGKIQLFLNETKHKEYEKITQNNKGKKFTVLYEGKSIGDFVIESVVTDGIIVFKTTLSSNEAVTFCDKI